MSKKLNIRSNWKHSTLEYLIRKNDPSPDMSRGAVYERAVKAAQGIENWKEYQVFLHNMKKEEKAQVFNSYQVKICDEVEQIRETIRSEILKQLTDINVLQEQYMVQLLLANYLEKLKQEKLMLNSENHIEETEVDLPEMSAIFMEIALKDKDCEVLREIRKILVEWRNNQ